MSQFQLSDFSFVRQKPAPPAAPVNLIRSIDPTTEADSIAHTVSVQQEKCHVRVTDAPALTVRKSLAPLPSLASQSFPQAQHDQHADQQQPLPMRSKLSVAPAWKKVVRDSPATTAKKAAPPLIDRLASLTHTTVQMCSPSQADQQHVAGVIAAHVAGHKPLSIGQQALAGGNKPTRSNESIVVSSSVTSAPHRQVNATAPIPSDSKVSLAPIIVVFAWLWTKSVLSEAMSMCRAALL